MKVWAIADLHLSFSVPEKTMELFGPPWKQYQEKLREGWLKAVDKEDLVLIAGDISWAKRLENALIDLRWLDGLPGKKVICRGNHDYWWPSNQKLAGCLPSSFFFIHNNALDFGPITIGGTRLWDFEEVDYAPYIEMKPHPNGPPPLIDPEMKKKEDLKIFKKERLRLQRSLEAMNPKAETKIVMLHFPPLSPEHLHTEVTELLEQYGIDICVYGHLHNLKAGFKQFGLIKGIRYYLTAADYLEFNPLRIL